MNMNEQSKKDVFAGFDLAGQRLENGDLKAYLGESIMKDWPQEVEILGHTFTLEEVVHDANGYETAVYV